MESKLEREGIDAFVRDKRSLGKVRNGSEMYDVHKVYDSFSYDEYGNNEWCIGAKSYHVAVQAMLNEIDLESGYLEAGVIEYIGYHDGVSFVGMKRSKHDEIYGKLITETWEGK